MLAIMRDSQAVLPDAPPALKPKAFVADRMLAPDQAVLTYFARVRLAPPGVEHVGLGDALQRVLSEDARAREDLPLCDRSTMDGFAVASRDGELPRRLVGEVRMGQPAPRGIASREALRIPTGGTLPDGADAVVPAEDAHERDGEIVPHGRVAPGDFLTRRASDLRAGETALAAGRRIGAPELGVLATVGVTHVPVFRRPVFGLLSTGDELIDAGGALHVGQVRDSNRFAIAGALRAMGADVVQLPRAPDDRDALREAVREALNQCDGVVLTGGSSVGARDLVPDVTADLGEPGVIVHGIRLKPGKPTMLAAIGTSPVIGLPGNPTSCLMVLETVVRPIIAACTGERVPRTDAIDAIADADFVGREGWTWYVPAQVRSVGGRLFATPLPLHSAYVSLLARACGYVVVGERPHRIERGTPLRVHRFSVGGAPVMEATA